MYVYREYKNKISKSIIKISFKVLLCYIFLVLLNIGSSNTFFLANALKKTTEYFLQLLFLFESTILPVNNGK